MAKKSLKVKQQKDQKYNNCQNHEFSFDENQLYPSKIVLLQWIKVIPSFS